VALLAVVSGLGLLALAAPSTGWATPSSSSLSDLQSQARAVQDQIDALDDEFEIIVEDYNASHMRLEAIDSDLVEIRMELSRRQSELEAKQELVAQRLVWMYKVGDSGIIDALLSAGSFTDAEKQFDFFKLLTQEDSAVQDEFSALTADVAGLESAVAKQREDEAAVEQKVDESRLLIEEKLTERQAFLDNLDSRILTILEQQAALDAAEAGRLGEAVNLATLQGTPAQIGVIRDALQFLGVPYVWGGATPSGFDCSGLVLYVYRNYGVAFPHFAAYQANMGRAVSVSELQPADLVFFGSPIHHVGIYAGNGLFIQAPHTGDVVKVTRLSTYELPSACRRYDLHLL
jgi:peptidoglycan DL-endopeptidase CwlO